ncbi:MAG: beta-ketoacyl synthase N-terminal-like domain-containing protein, partial [Bacteroidales bacterium]
MMGLRRVVISGLGALTPIGNDVNTLWASLVDGVSGAGPITRFNAEKFKTKFACEVKGYDPLNFFDKKEVRKYDLFSQFGIVAADEAINDSGFKQGNYNPERVGVIWASGIGGIMT